MVSPQSKLQQTVPQQLVKAKLFSLNSEEYDIAFMFNPTQLDFTRSIKLNSPAGARDKKGQSKVSFANPDPCQIKLSKILFDTYEQGTSVLTYIEQLTKAVKFIDEKTQRPPIYLLIWGSNDYLRCFVESFNYQLTMFLPDGTPVRATANLTLKEVDESVVPGQPRTPTNPDRFGDSRASRTVVPGNPRTPTKRERSGDRRASRSTG